MSLLRNHRLLLVAGAVALLVAAVSAVRGTHAAFSAEESFPITVSSGSVALAHVGDALVFDSAALAPGDTATASVELENTGTLASELTLQREKVASTAPAGCDIRDALRLTVASGDDELLDAPLATAAASQALGTLAAGARRTYELTLTFEPQHGATDADNDNCFQGSTDQERFTWTAVEDRS